MQCNNNNNNNTLLHWLFKSFKALVFGCLKFKQNPVTSSIYTLIKVLIEAISYLLHWLVYPVDATNSIVLMLTL